MKFTIDVECTPKEARAFLGLPDVEEFQRAMMEQARERTVDWLGSMEPEKLARMWMPGGLEGWERAMQDAFTKFTTAATGSGGSGSGNKE